MPNRVSSLNIHIKRHLFLLGGFLLLMMLTTVQAQVTETEAKYQKTLKDFSPIEVLPKFGKGRWCGWISDEPGTIFDNSNYPLIQSLVIYGNPQYQYAYVNGTDMNGERFSGDQSELRRFKLGARAHLLKYFTARMSFDMLEDSKAKVGDNSRSSDYSLSTTDLIFDAQDAFNWECYDQFQLRLGYFKVPSNAGRSTSSNSMRAIERAYLTDYSSPTDSMGMMVSARRNGWDFDLGFFSNNDIQEGFNTDSGSFWVGHIGYVFEKQERVDFIRGDLRVLVNNDPELSKQKNYQSTFTHDWVVSASTTMRKKHWRLMADVIMGDNGDNLISAQSGRYWGINIMPSAWLMEDRLEAVLRYQYAHAQKSQGYRIASHSARSIADEVGASINNGYGDRHHSAYAGLNYYICGDHTKVMAGVQWDDLKSNNRQVYEGLTTWVAVRLYF